MQLHSSNDSKQIIKLVKTFLKNKQNVNKVHRIIKNCNYHQLLTSKNDV